MTTRTTTDASEIARRAVPLFDREAPPAGVGPGDDEAVERRLSRWRQTAAGDDPGFFEQRLANDGLDVAAARRLLAATAGSAGEVPPWLDFLESAARGAGGAAAGRPAGALLPDAPLPFEDVLLPLVAAAGARVEAGLPRGWEGIGEAGAGALHRHLLGRLSGLAAPALFLEFSIFRQERESALTRLLRAGATPAPTGLYQAFVARYAGDRARALWAGYPVVARLAGTVCLQWIDTVGTFLRHLEADRGRIAAELNGGADPGRVESLRAGVSDPHNGGRTALSVRFASGLRAVYKPHVLGMETCWFELLRWVNDRGAALPLRVLTVIDAGDHGWVEFAEQGPCADEAAAADYFRRAGMLLCLARALGGSDLHLENVVACGEQPVIVDLEMILQPEGVKDGAAAGAAVAEVQRRIGESVLATGLLPAWIELPGGKAMNLAGLGGAFGGTRTLAWKQVNTDDMDRVAAEGEGAARENRVAVGDRFVPVESYADEMVEGFASMHALLQEHRQRLLAADGPVERFAGQEVRFVFRPTRVYGRVLEYLLDPRFMRDGLDRGIEADALARPFAGDAATDAVWQMLRAERRAMERQDVPYFHLPAAGDAVSGEGYRIDGLVATAPLARARERIQALDERDLRGQVELIRVALSAVQSSDREAAGAAGPQARPSPGLAQPPSGDALIACARRIGRLLADRAVLGEDGSAAWMGGVTADADGHCSIQCLDHSLYEGSVGVAIFLAALGEIAGDGFRELARGGLASVRGELGKPETRLAVLAGIGAGSGVGGIVYALLRAARHLGDEALLDDAVRAAALITPKAVDADGTYDVIGGSAGAILSLLALHDVAGDDRVLASAEACGRRLLAGRTAAQDGARAWKTMDGCPPLAGFAHGVAGIAYALLRLSERTGDPALRAAAAEAIEYERTLFVPEDGNWRDLRQPDEPRAGMSAWCHGATGIGLARLGGLRALDTAEVRSEIEAAIGTTSALGTAAPYRLCCGLSGRVELLLEAAATLGRPELRAQAAALLGAAIAGADGSAEGLFGPWRLGLFQGIAGFGYACLRAAAPDRVPPLLLWRA